MYFDQLPADSEVERHYMIFEAAFYSSLTLASCAHVKILHSTQTTRSKNRYV